MKTLVLFTAMIYVIQTVLMTYLTYKDKLRYEYQSEAFLEFLIPFLWIRRVKK